MVKKSLWFRADNLKPLLGFGCCLVMIRIGFRAGDPIMALPDSSLNQINVMSAPTFITFFFSEIIFVLPPLYLSPLHGLYITDNSNCMVSLSIDNVVSNYIQ